MMRAVLASLSALLLWGCSTTSGTFEPRTQFVYPNSNVKALGPTEASAKKVGFLGFISAFDRDEIQAVYDEAISKVEGADILLDFQQDTTVTSYPFVTVITYRIRGTAANMEVGIQDLY